MQRIKNEESIGASLVLLGMGMLLGASNIENDSRIKRFMDTINPSCETAPRPPLNQKVYVYGIKGLAELFGVSIPTAQKIKNSGRIDAAITTVGKKLIIDRDLALELAKNTK